MGHGLAGTAPAPRLTQDYGPGNEPQSVRDAWDAHLQAQREAATRTPRHYEADGPVLHRSGSGNPEGEPPMTSIADDQLPTRADLDAATARTAAVLADPAATRADRVHAAEMEQAVHHRYLQRPGADAELQAEAELEAGT